MLAGSSSDIAPPRATIHVLHVGPSEANRGGMAAVIRALLASPPGDGYRLEALATWRSKARLRRVLTFARSLLAVVRWTLRPGRRVVHVHTAVRGSIYRKAVVVVLVRALRRPVLLQVHAGPGDIEHFAAGLGALRRAAFRRALRAASSLAAVSAATATALREAFVDLDVAVIPNPAPPVRSGLRRSQGDRGVRLLYAGGFLNPAKGGGVLAEALPRVLDSIPGATATVAGSGEPPAQLRAAAGERLRWRGWLDSTEMRAERERCDVFVLPSISEGLPMALLEAMAGGCAIVASRVGGVPEVLTDGEDAVLVAPGDPQQLAEALVRVGQDAGLRERLGARAAERARVLNRDDVNGRLVVIYNHLTS